MAAMAVGMALFAAMNSETQMGRVISEIMCLLLMAHITAYENVTQEHKTSPKGSEDVKNNVVFFMTLLEEYDIMFEYNLSALCTKSVFFLFNDTCCSQWKSIKSVFFDYNLLSAILLSNIKISSKTFQRLLP